MAMIDLDGRRPELLLAAGLALVTFGALLRAPSRPLAARTEAAALAVLLGAILLLTGVYRFKRRRDERRRRRRRRD